MLNLSDYVFSKSGSYLAIDKKENELLIMSSYGGKYYPLYAIKIEEDAEIDMKPWELTVKSGGEYKFCFFGKSGLFIKGKKKPLTIEYREAKNDYNVNFVRETENGIAVGDTINNGVAYLTATHGKLSYSAPMNVGEESRKFLAKRKEISVTFGVDGEDFIAAIERFFNGCDFSACGDFTYDEAVAAAREEYERFEKLFIEKKKNANVAIYVLWCNTLPKDGYLTRIPICPSRAGMTRVWSWDNVFNSIALAEYHPELAFDQIMIPYDLITADGQIPDAVSAIRTEWTNVKPPVQGWAYKILLKKNAYFGKISVLKQVYFPMKRNTDWWLNMRGKVPSYYHGNDSGADNSTCFDFCDQVETPELLALLSLQCEFLSETAQKLELYNDEKIYGKLAEELRNKACNNYFDGKIFIKDGFSGVKHYCDSLLPLRVLILGEKLPESIKNYIVERLRNDFLGEYGLASEALNSEKYEKDAYWRGSLWAPDQYMIAYGLNEIGESALAREILNRYKSAIEKNGFYENYDAHTGEKERCKNFSWSVCCYLEDI